LYTLGRRLQRENRRKRSKKLERGEGKRKSKDKVENAEGKKLIEETRGRRRGIGLYIGHSF
jgi:hypothetical protein